MHIHKMGTFLLSSLFLALVLVQYPISLANVFAADSTTNADSALLQQQQAEIDQLKQKLAKVQGEAATLSQAVSYLNTKQELARKQVAATQFQIDLLQKDIDSLGGKITFLEGSLNTTTASYIKTVAASYKESHVDILPLLLSQESASTLLARYKYLKVSQQYRQDLLIKTTQAKLAYDAEKSQKEKKQKDIESLKQKFVKQQEELLVQQKAKQALLAETKNSEANYQKLLAQALAEKNAIEQALISGSKVGPVKRGDVIALVGNSGYPGCSTAKHLHFEVRKNNTWVDPTSYLENRSITDDQEGGTRSIGSGSWSWPIQNPIHLTQHFGHTPWSYRYKYSGGIHTGFDMVSKSSDVIRAPADGTLFRSSEKCGSSTINIVYIEHGDNVVSFYLHVQ